MVNIRIFVFAFALIDRLGDRKEVKAITYLVRSSKVEIGRSQE